MKTKSRGGIVNVVRSGWLKDFYWSSPHNDYVQYLQSSWDVTLRNGMIETIQYDDTKRTGTLKRTRWCRHDRVRIENNLEEHTHFQDVNGTYYRAYASGGGYTPDFLTIPDLASVHSEALDFFKSGCVEKHFDLAVDLLEWRQVATLLPSLRTSFARLKAQFVKDNHLTKLIDFKYSLKDLSNIHLSYAFGIKPLLSDIEGLYKSVSALKEKVAWLRKHQGKPVKVRFSKDLSTSNLPSTSMTDYSDTTFGDKIQVYHCRYNAYALLVYNVEALSDLELKLRILTRNFGLDKPLTWIYENVSFSFVLDWVLKVGDLIENLSPSISLPYTFLDVGYTVRVREVRERLQIFKFPRKGDNFHSYAKLDRTAFLREPGLPVSFSVATGKPGAEQLALAISLAIQKW